MKTMEIQNISIQSDRQRQFFDEFAIVELADSIVKNGLLHPIVLTQDYVLVAGERRYKAVEHLTKQGQQYTHNGVEVDAGHIPFTLTTESELLALEEMELAENLDRKDLTWQEQANTAARLHELRLKQSPNQTIKDTATELKGSDALGSDITSVSDDIKLAKQLSDPEIAGAKTKKEAVKILKTKVAEEHRKELANQFLENVKESEQYQFEQGDCLELIREIKSESIDCVLTDPPYGVEAQTFGDQAGVKHKYDDSLDEVIGLMTELIPELYRVSAVQSHLYMFCDFNLFHKLKDYLESAGFYVWKTPIIWYKGNIGHLPRPEHAPRSTYECIIYAIKGDKKTNMIAHDVISIPQTTNKDHAAQKPVELYTNLLARSVKPGDRILDTFAGSGTIFEAGRLSDCFAIGFERDDDYSNIIRARLHTTHTAR